MPPSRVGGLGRVWVFLSSWGVWPDTGGHCRQGKCEEQGSAGAWETRGSDGRDQSDRGSGMGMEDRKGLCEKAVAMK